MRFSSFLFCAVFVLLAPCAQAEEGFLTLTVENDSLATGMDRDYTSGVRLGWTQAAATSSTAQGLLDVLPMARDVAVMHLALGQNLYTPRDLSLKKPDPKDHPYAGFLYASFGLEGVAAGHADKVEVTAGMVGPASMGKEAQQFVHTLLDAPMPQGWGHQLKNEPGLMLSYERAWLDRAGADIGAMRISAEPYAGVMLGNFFTYGNVGLRAELFPQGQPRQAWPQRIAPAISGSGVDNTGAGQFAWSLFAGLEGRAVARNIFLDGNTFTASPHVEKYPLAGDASIGVALAYGRARINYTLTARPPEFEGQRGSDFFGSVGLQYRF